MFSHKSLLGLLRILLSQGLIMLCVTSGFFSESAGTMGGVAEQPLSSSPIRIMPLGDSITESGRGLASYRFYLWQESKRTGIPILFVGSQQGVRDGHPREDFDQHHEGHSGWRADQILDHITSWAEAARPDFVLIHLGTNDLWQGQSVDETAEEIADVIRRLQAVNPRVHILLAQLIPSSLPGLRDIVALNERLAVVTRDSSSDTSAVQLVDLASGFDPRTMTTDGVHPNEAGERWMAERWATALIPQLRTFQTGKGDGR